MLYEAGSLRIQPASYFSGEDHNHAVRDDELALSFSIPLSREDVVNLVVNKQDVPPEIPDQRVNVRVGSNADYWLYCVTSSVEPRLFVDFVADACVIIRDRMTFREMLRSTSEQHLGVPMGDGRATYADPILPTTAEIFIPLTKHFRYSYQDEHRFYWLPTTPTEKLSYVDVSIGSIRGIADLIVL